MSSYFNGLDPIARGRYEEKLTLLGLSKQEGPYLLWNTDKFVESMSLWPPVEYGHIFCYFVERPGVFTRSELMHWKSLEAYNYFQSGHVRNIKVYKAQSSSILVNHSQSAPNNAHQAWVGLRADGKVIAVHCTSAVWQGKLQEIIV